MARIKHIALTTKDPAGVASFYKEAFGLQEIRRAPNGAVFLTDGYINLAILNWKTENLPMSAPMDPITAASIISGSRSRTSTRRRRRLEHAPGQPTGRESRGSTWRWRPAGIAISR